MAFAIASASSVFVAVPEGGWVRWSSLSRWLNRSLSSVRSMLSGEVPIIGAPRLFERQGELERRLAAELDDDARGLFPVDDLEHVFERQGFKIKPVARIVVRAHRLGVAVHHDGLEARFRQRHHGVNAAVIELDALPDAVGAAAQDDDFLTRSRRGLVFLLIGGIEIRRMGLELRGTGIHLLVDGPHTQAVPRRAHQFLLNALLSGNLQITESVLLQIAEAELVIEQAGRGGLFFQFDEFGQMRQEPGVDARGAVYFIFRPSFPVGTGDGPEPVGAGYPQTLLY